MCKRKAEQEPESQRKMWLEEQESCIVSGFEHGGREPEPRNEGCRYSWTRQGNMSPKAVTNEYRPTLISA